MPGTDRRHSTSSEDANAPPAARQLSQDGTEIIPTRMSKVTTPKPASNPLQFVKTGPCDLYKAAQEQIKKVEEIKKVEKVKDDSEDWQSNLDNWKCSRRKRQEHIIERVVEVKKLELEEHDRNRRRSKTFNEMMEERSSKGGRKMSILSYPEDDSNDLSDLGISINKEKSDGDYNNENKSQNGSDNEYHANTDNGTQPNNSNGHNSHTSSNYDEESSTPATISSPEPEEYTYERAIQGYKSFAEAKVKTPIKTATERKGLNGSANFKVSPVKKEPSGKIGEKLSELEQIRLRSKSTNDINGGSEAKQLPKVDVHKRRSLFENVEAVEALNIKSADRIPKDLSNTKSVKERLSTLEKNNENVTKVNRLSGEVFPYIEKTISSLERQKSVDSGSGKRLSNGDISPQISIKERLNSLEKQNEPEVSKNKIPAEEIRPVSIKERMSSFDATSHKEPTPKLTPERDAGFKDKLETFKSTEKNQNEILNSINTNSLNCSESKKVEITEKKDEPEIETPVEEEKVEAAATEQIESVPKQDSVPVSSESSQVVVEGSGDGLSNSANEKEEVTNTEVEGCDKMMLRDPDRTQGCDISETIRISLPDSTVPCPRFNISVSVDSISKSSSNSDEEEEAQDEFPDEIPPGYRDSLTMNNPKTRRRKLTPMVSSPKITVSPLKTVCELQIIEEGEGQAPQAPEEEKKEEVVEEEEEKFVAVHMNPKNLYQSNQEVQELVEAPMSKDMEKELEEEQQDESSVYTDENIDEVLGKDEEVETCVDEEGSVTEETKIQKELEVFTPKEPIDNINNVQTLKQEISEKPLPLQANYENVFINNQVPQLCMSPDSDIYATLSFPLGSRPTIEPPKEKPPPPPLELSDDESTKPELPPKPSLRRLDSTKRIKKEIRKKRSDFLGIEGTNDDSYLEPEIYVAPPPDMMTFLQEERRLEQQLYRQSICSESDSNHETAESRDSGVELDRGHVDDICWSKPDVLSEPHSRQNSETFGNTSITSEEDEILKKEREIIEVLEKEEQWRYGNKNSPNGEQNDIGEKLAVKLRQLEQEKMALERERAEEEGRRKAEESARRQSEQRLMAKQQQLREQENSTSHSNPDSSNEQEALRFERERLQKEQEHLERYRQNLLKQKQQQSEPIEIHHRGNISHWDTPSNRHSLQEVPIGVPMQDVPRHSMQDVSQPQYQPPPMTSGYRYSLPDLQQREPRSSRPPPPIPPAKPIRPMTQEQWERETNIRNSRIPSADNIPLQIEASTKLRHGSSVPAINIHHGGQQMTRSTLHALSAAPRSRIITSENWMQPKRKVDAPKNNYNYQHWLIQEAEHRRILEHQQKVSQQLQPKRTLPYNGQSSGNFGSPPSHHTVGLPISPPVQGQSAQRWMSPPRTDKPLPDAVIQTLTQRVQSRENKTPPRRRVDAPAAATTLPNKVSPPGPETHLSGQSQERMLSVSGKKKCSHCNEELGRGAAMIIESLRLFYHIDCFKCCVCHVQLGDGLMGTDVRVRNNKLHCHNCYSSDDELPEEIFQYNKIEIPLVEGDECSETEEVDAAGTEVTFRLGATAPDTLGATASAVLSTIEEEDALALECLKDLIPSSEVLGATASEILGATASEVPGATATEVLSTIEEEDAVALECDKDLVPSFEVLAPFPLANTEDLPDWFKEFYNVYQFNESRKFILMQQMHLQMIDFEIKKCELLKEIIDKLKDH